VYRCGQRRLIGEPEVLAKPKDRWRGHRSQVTT
jgi:hypothetical protein